MAGGQGLALVLLRDWAICNVGLVWESISPYLEAPLPQAFVPTIIINCIKGAHTRASLYL